MPNTLFGKLVFSDLRWPALFRLVIEVPVLRLDRPPGMSRSLTLELVERNSPSARLRRMESAGVFVIERSGEGAHRADFPNVDENDRP